MQKIILLEGIPASGKSTWAREQIEKNPGVYKRVNKDDLRAMMDVSHRSKGNETFVLSVRDFIIKAALLDGKNVIVDDTNLHPKHGQRMLEIAKEVGNTEVIVQRFEIGLEDAIERDLKRPNSVGPKVIKMMYKQMYQKDSTELYVPDLTRAPAVIFDIDGTLAKMVGRSPYERNKVGTDILNIPVYEAYKKYSEDHCIIIFTGRDGVCEQQTKERLNDNKIAYSHFDIRSVGDGRKDCVIKREMFDKIRDRFNVRAVFDDRDQVVSMWRNMGLQCFQVADGDF